LRGLDLTVYEGEFLMLMGASGSGKTTLMNIIGCLDRPSSGSFQFKGQAVEHLDDNQLSHLRKREIGFIFQSFNLLPRLKAWANVALPLVYQEVPASRRRAVAEEMLRHVGLDQKGERLPGELSGGEQQRVAIARALASHPHLLLADEPTGNLDSKTGEEIMEILKNLHHDGITIVMVTHAREMIKYSDRSIFMKDGLILEG
jgi:putative ABC transport system ATP-binding protein